MRKEIDLNDVINSERFGFISNLFFFKIYLFLPGFVDKKAFFLA